MFLAKQVLHEKFKLLALKTGSVNNSLKQLIFENSSFVRYRLYFHR